MNAERKTWITVSIFAISMGLLEAIVVVYLRELYYPGGFSFPLKAMNPELISTELLREVATVIMLLCTGLLAGHNGMTRFAWFIYAFAVWDLFYYVFLKLLLSWPDSLMTWDILFLIPVTWVGPVLGPVINSITMIVLAILLIRGNRKHQQRLNSFEWMLLIVGSLLVILSYTREYTSFLLTKFSFEELFRASKTKDLLDFGTSFVPEHFDWLLYCVGVSLHWLVLGLVCMRIYSCKDVRSKR